MQEISVPMLSLLVSIVYSHVFEFMSAMTRSEPFMSEVRILIYYIFLKFRTSDSAHLSDASLVYHRTCLEQSGIR